MQHPAHELIERYLSEVARRLPDAEREDVLQELRSLLLDGLDDRAGGAPPDEETVVELLRGMGPPEQMAARYQLASRSLIGPHLYPVFLTVARFTLIGLTVTMALIPALSLVGTAMAGASLWSAGWAAQWAWLFVQAIAFSLSTLVLVFAFAERVMARPDQPVKPTSPRLFDPRSLPATPARQDPDRIAPGWMVARVYLITALFVLLNYFPRWFGPFFASSVEKDGETMFTAGAVPISVLGIHVPVAVFDVWWLVAMALSLAVLRQGRWMAATRRADIALRALGATVLAITIACSVGGYDAVWVHARYPELDSATPVLRVILLLILLWMFVWTTIGTATRLYREVRRAPARFQPMERHC
jgi:hypothetical protein